MEIKEGKKINNYKKRFVRYKEGAELYSIGLNKFEKMAREAGACYKVDKLVLVNLDEFDAYLATFKLSGI